jgi:hypothetical protein
MRQDWAELIGPLNNSCIPIGQVLIYDKTGQNVIGPLLSVKDLRELGVTLHLSLHSERYRYRSLFPMK